jgi:hypothetical protein
LPFIFNLRPLQNPPLVVAAVCDRRGFLENLRPFGVHRAPLQGVCRGINSCPAILSVPPCGGGVASGICRRPKSLIFPMALFLLKFVDRTFRRSKTVLKMNPFFVWSM